MVHVTVSISLSVTVHPPLATADSLLTLVSSQGTSQSFEDSLFRPPKERWGVGREGQLPPDTSRLGVPIDYPQEPRF